MSWYNVGNGPMSSKSCGARIIRDPVGTWIETCFSRLRELKEGGFSPPSFLKSLRGTDNQALRSDLEKQSQLLAVRLIGDDPDLAAGR